MNCRIILRLPLVSNFLNRSDYSNVLRLKAKYNHGHKEQRGYKI